MQSTVTKDVESVMWLNRNLKRKQPRYNAVAYYAKSRGNQANQAYHVSPDSQSRRARAEPGQ